MIKLIEVTPLPSRCLGCEEAKRAEAKGFSPDAYCYNCDYALDRFQMEQVKEPK